MTFEIDINGRTRAVSIERGARTATFHVTVDGRAHLVDALGRRTRREHAPSGSFRSWTYAALAVTEADENDNDASSPHAGTTTTRTSDGRGRIVGVTEQIDCPQHISGRHELCRLAPRLINIGGLV